jgi:hypothetical protein
VQRGGRGGVEVRAWAVAVRSGGRARVWRIWIARLGGRVERESRKELDALCHMVSRAFWWPRKLYVPLRSTVHYNFAALLNYSPAAPSPSLLRRVRSSSK